MRALLRTQRGNLVILGLTVACVALLGCSVSGVTDIIAALGLALYLTGAALVAAVDPGRTLVHGAERLMWEVGTSLSALVLGGVLLNAVSNLSRAHWVTYLAVVSGAGLAVAAVRAARLAGSEEPVRVRVRVTVRQVGLLVATVALLAVALVVSERSQAQATHERFVQAWIVPRPVKDVASTKAELGVTNFSGGAQSFVVLVVEGAGLPSAHSIELAEGQSWTFSISRTPEERVTATVATSAHPATILARVFLAPPVA
jgi:hypothetical protein